MVYSIAEALAELVDAMPCVDEAIRAERRRRRREREWREERPRIEAGALPVK